MSASTGDVLYDRPFSFPPASIAFCRGRAKRDPSVGVCWICRKPAPVRASGPIKKHWTCRCGFFKEIEMRDVKCLPVIKFASVCEFDGCLHLAS